MGEPFVNCGITTEQAKEAYEQHGSYLRAGEALGVSRATIKRRLQHLQGHQDEQGDPNEQIKTVHSENGMSLTVVSRSIRTKEDALRKAGLSEDEWEITKATANNWPVTIKDPQTGHPTKVNQWQFKLELKPRATPGRAESHAGIGGAHRAAGHPASRGHHPGIS